MSISADGYYAEGVNCVKARSFREAIHLFSRSIFLSPSEHLPIIARAEAYVHLGDIMAASNNYRMAIAILEDTGDTTEVYGLGKRLAQLLDMYSVIVYREGNSEGALRFSNESLKEMLTPIALFHKGVYLCSLDKFAEAETILRDILDAAPEEAHTETPYPDAQMLLSRILIFSRRDFYGANKMIENCLKNNPDNLHVKAVKEWFDKAFDIFRRTAVQELSVPNLTLCINTFPEDPELYKARALAYIACKDNKMAARDLFMSLKKSDGRLSESSSLIVSVLATIGDDLAAKGDYAGAIKYYTDSLKRDTTRELSNAILVARSDCYAAIGKYKESLSDLKEVVIHDPQNEAAISRLSKIHDIYGSLFYNEQKYEEAEVEFTNAIDFYDKDPTVFYHRALARAMQQKGALMTRDLLTCRSLYATDPKIVNMINQYCTRSIGAEISNQVFNTCRFHYNQIKMTQRNDLKSRIKSTKEPIELDIKTIRDRHKDDLDCNIFSPSNIRQSIQKLNTSTQNNTKVTINALGETKINGKDTKRILEEKRIKPMWESCQKKCRSRHDRFDVSKPQPIPQLYRYTPPLDIQHLINDDRYRPKDDSDKFDPKEYQCYSIYQGQ